MQEIEIWKPVKDYDGFYEVSNLGRVRSISGKIRILNGNLSSMCYIKVHFSKLKVKKFHLLHRLIAIAFIENPENKPCINHVNGVKTDNRVENLEWCTMKENIIHAYKTGLINKKGEKSGRATITNEDAIAVYNSKEKTAVLSKRYGLQPQQVNKIRSGHSWSDITNHKIQ